MLNARDNISIYKCDSHKDAEHIKMALSYNTEHEYDNEYQCIN